MENQKKTVPAGPGLNIFKRGVFNKCNGLINDK
jgi:hypothetical protein